MLLETVHFKIMFSSNIHILASCSPGPWTTHKFIIRFVPDVKCTYHYIDPYIHYTDKIKINRKHYNLFYLKTYVIRTRSVSISEFQKIRCCGPIINIIDIII